MSERVRLTRDLLQFPVSAILLGCCILLPATGCQDDSSSSDGGSAADAGKRIGAAGGTLSSADGRLTLEVPPGAVSKETLFTIAPTSSAPSGYIGTAYEIGPSGLRTKAPLRLIFRYPEKLPQDVLPAALFVATVVRDQWKPLLPRALDTDKRTLESITFHLSRFAVRHIPCSVSLAQAGSSSDPCKKHNPLLSCRLIKRSSATPWGFCGTGCGAGGYPCPAPTQCKDGWWRQQDVVAGQSLEECALVPCNPAAANPCGVASNSTCVNGICSRACDTKHPCGANLECFHGLCVIKSCKGDKDCDSSYLCKPIPGGSFWPDTTDRCIPPELGKRFPDGGSDAGSDGGADGGPTDGGIGGPADGGSDASGSTLLGMMVGTWQASAQFGGASGTWFAHIDKQVGNTLSGSGYVTAPALLASLLGICANQRLTGSGTIVPNGTTGGTIDFGLASGGCQTVKFRGSYYLQANGAHYGSGTFSLPGIALTSSSWTGRRLVTCADFKNGCVSSACSACQTFCMAQAPKPCP